MRKKFSAEKYFSRLFFSEKILNSHGYNRPAFSSHPTLIENLIMKINLMSTILVF